jgi:uncharacterized protein YndB with AHSA1/START domain
MNPDSPPIVVAEMLIRKPVPEVYRAFVDPAVTTHFWFTRSSGPLVAGRQVEWFWDMYGVSAEVSVLELEENERIVIEWDDPPTRVEWSFAPHRGRTTQVRITNSGFSGTRDEQVKAALDAMGGFSFVLAGLKAWLEHGIALDLIGDHFPDAHIG